MRLPAAALFSLVVTSCLLLLASGPLRAQDLTSAVGEVERLFEQQMLFDRLTRGEALAALATAQFVVSNAPDIESQALGRRALAEIARRQSDFAAAEAHLRAVISLYPGSSQVAWARFGLGLLFLDLAGPLMRPEPRRAALTEFRAVLDMNPAHPVASRALEKIALTHLNSRDPRKAVEIYKSVLATYPGTPGAVFAHGGLARAYRDLRRWDDAIRHARLRAAFAGYPRCDEFQLMAGTVLAEKGDYAAAEEVCRKVISTYPSSPRALEAVTAIAGVYLKRGRPDRAIGWLKALAAEHPASEIGLQAELRIGRVDLEQGRLEEADALFARLAAERPKGPQAEARRRELSQYLYGLAREEFFAKNYPLAIKHMKLALADDSGNSEWWMGLRVLGQSHQGLRQYEEAIAVYRRAVETFPDSPEAAAAQFQIGECRRKQGRCDEAIAEYREVLERWPDSGMVAHAENRIEACEQGDPAQIAAQMRGRLQESIGRLEDPAERANVVLVDILTGYEYSEEEGLRRVPLLRPDPDGMVTLSDGTRIPVPPEPQAPVRGKPASVTTRMPRERSARATRAAAPCPSPWIVIDREPGFGRVSPYDFGALGPILAVRRHLSEVQWSSLKNDDPQAPVLARFEIVDAYSLDMDSPHDLASGLAGKGSLGFTVRAILYWAVLDPTTRVPRRATEIVRERGPSGRTAVYQEGPQFTRVRLETVEYTVKPNDVSTPSKKGARESIIQAETGWKVDGEKVLSSRTVVIGEVNKVLPLYDLSAQKLSKTAVGPGARQRVRPAWLANP
jgi:TolA-binding protein